MEKHAQVYTIFCPGYFGGGGGETIRNIVHPCGVQASSKIKLQKETNTSTDTAALPFWVQGQLKSPPWG